MAFVYKKIRKEDTDYKKYIDLEQRYMEDTPKEILEKHNYIYSYEGDRLYRKQSSIGNRGVIVVRDDEREIYLLLIHFEDSRPDYYATPMAWILFFDSHMILMNCDYDDEMGLLDSGKRWLKNRYLIEPLLLPDIIKNRESEVKQYIVDALTVFSESGGSGGGGAMFARINTEVIFDQPYYFQGYN